MADTKRITSSPVSASADTARNTIKSVVVTVDAKRITSKPATVTADACRICDNQSTAVTVSVDAKRTKTGAVSVAVDTKRKRKGVMSDIVSLNIGLNNQVLADSYSIASLNNLPLGTVFAGSINGWPWECTLKSKNKNPQSQQYRIGGDFDIADTLKKFITCERQSRLASSILAALAGQLGKTLVCLIDDHGVRRMSEQSTVMQILGSLFSWTTAAPNIMTNVFLRNNTLYAVQRGKEQSSYSPVKYNVTDYAEKKLDTLMDSGQWTPQIIGDPTGEYTNGTFAFNGCSIEYVDGYVVRTVDSTGAVQTFSWSSDDPNDPDVQRYMTQKTECPAGSQFPYVTNYFYDTWKGYRYLALEETTQYMTFYLPAVPGMMGSHPHTYTVLTYLKGIAHAPAGNGFYSSWGAEKKWTYGPWTTASGEVAGWGVTSYEAHDLPSQISEGRPGGSVTPREQSSEDTTPVLDVPFIPFVPSHIPVTDTATLQRYWDAIAALDGKTEINMTIECYDQHIIDYTETVTIDGKTWYLDGNEIELSGANPACKQTVRLVRWE